MIRSKKPQFNVNKEDIIELIKVIRKPKSPSKEARALTFINSDRNQDLFSQVAIPPPDVDVEDLNPQDYQIRVIMLKKPTLDTTKLMATLGMKDVFRSFEQEGAELITLCRQNEILRGYLVEVVGPLDLEHPEETLNTALKRRDGGGVQMDPFFNACWKWQEIFEEKGILIIQGNLNLLHAMQENVDKMVAILKQDFSIMDEVCAWSKDLQILQAIKGKRYKILVDVYVVKELDLIDHWIEKIVDSNKFMETLHAKIHRLKDQAREKILDAEKHYSDPCLDIFEDDEWEKLMPIMVVVENFQNIL